MNKHLHVIWGTLALSGLSVSAQSPVQPPPATQPSVLGSPVTVTGCLKPWPGPATTGTGTATTPPTSTSPPLAPPQYVLTDIDARASTPGSMPPAAATRGESTEPQNQYLLRAEAPSVDLSQHLNHKIEVTGRKAAIETAHGAATTEPAPMGATGAGSPGTGMPAPGMSRPSSPIVNPPTVTVTAIKMIAATCS